MRGTPFEAFCAAVLAQIRSSPARAGIAAELTAHLEDHAAALMEAGMPPEEAQAAAVAAMGDPAEIGRALDRLHSPLLEWTGLLTHVAACFAVAALIFAGLFAFFVQENSLLSGTAWNPDFWALGMAGGVPEEVDASVRAGWYTVRASRAALGPGPGEEGVVYCALTVWTPNPWRSDPRFLDRFEALDASGNSYAASLNRDTPFSPLQCHPFVSFALVKVSGVPRDLSEITLAFPRDERACFLTIPLTGGEPHG